MTRRGGEAFRPTTARGKTLCSGAVAKAQKKDPARLDGPLAGVLSRFDPHGRMRVFRVFDVWDEVVGPAIAERATPLRVRDAVLVVGVANHAWMQELVFLKEDIRARLNEQLGAPLVRELQFVLGAEKRRPLPVAGRPEAESKPLPPVAVPELPSTGSAELDGVLLRIATSLARWKQAKEPRKKKRTGAGSRGAARKRID